MLFFVSVSFALPIPKQSTWFPCSLRYEKRVVKLDAALVFRVNDRSRTDSPATEWAYAHYRTHMTASIALTLQDKLAGFILNVSLVRNTLSLRMRKLLRAGELCWLKTTGSIEMCARTISMPSAHFHFHDLRTHMPRKHSKVQTSFQGSI